MKDVSAAMWAEALSTHPFLAPVDTVLSEACRRKRSQIRLPRSHAEWGNNGATDATETGRSPPTTIARNGCLAPEFAHGTAHHVGAFSDCGPGGRGFESPRSPGKKAPLTRGFLLL
jgi:hypothetical protein